MSERNTFYYRYQYFHTTIYTGIIINQVQVAVGHEL